MPLNKPERPEALLMTIEEAAAILDVSAAPLRRAAEQHGFLILIGRSAWIEWDELDDLVKAMRVPPTRKDPS